MSSLPPGRVRPVNRIWLAKRLEQLAADGPSLRYEDLPKNLRGHPRDFSPEWSAWSSRVSGLLRAHFQEPSPVYWATATADQRLDDIFAEPQSSFENVKDLYLEAIELALKTLRAKALEAGDSR